MEEQENDFANDLFSYELVDDDPKEYSHIYNVRVTSKDTQLVNALYDLFDDEFEITYDLHKNQVSTMIIWTASPREREKAVQKLRKLEKNPALIKRSEEENGY